ncbi:MAG: MarR family winged helix-turn-helix transcriptional regulator [Acidimicrobiales bacterium]
MADERRTQLPFDPIAEARRHWDDRWDEGRAMAAATSVMRAQQLVLAEVDRALRPFGLTFARYEVLVLLLFSRRGSLPMGKMGSRLMVHPTSVTSIVDRLERDGLVRRVAHPGDRRIVLAELTPAGRELALRATKSVEAVRFGVGELTDGQLDQLTRLVARLRRAAGDFAG